MSVPMAARTGIPPLENGDRLSRDEFERRYVAMPENVRAELIEGIVYMASPVRFEAHAQPHGRMVTWLGNHADTHPGVLLGVDATVRLDAHNEPQPDAFLRYEAGRSRLLDDDYIEGAPELVLEISASTASRDLHVKKEVYGRAGALEYITWRVRDGELDWFILRNDAFESLDPGSDGITESEAFPGLRMNVKELLAGNYAAALREPMGFSIPPEAN